MSKKILIPFAEGFEEIEGTTLVDVLRRADLEVTVAGVGTKDIRGAHGVAYQMEVTLDEVRSNTFDAVVLPGGMPGAANLAEDKTLEEILKRHASEGKILAAICAAPTVLSKYGFLKGKKATAYPSFDEKLEGCELAKGEVVRDGNITTSRGPGTAMAFALDLVEQLCGSSKMEAQAEALLYHGS